MKTTIKLITPVDLRGENGKGAYVKNFDLRDMTAGDYIDASRMVPENASRMELEMQVAAICSDTVPMAVLRAMRPYDMAQISEWHDKQWSPPKEDKGEGAEEDADPSKAGAAS